MKRFVMLKILYLHVHPPSKYKIYNMTRDWRTILRFSTQVTFSAVRPSVRKLSQSSPEPLG